MAGSSIRSNFPINLRWSCCKGVSWLNRYNFTLHYLIDKEYRIHTDFVRCVETESLHNALSFPRSLPLKRKGIVWRVYFPSLS